jgi:hypothetical protein
VVLMLAVLVACFTTGLSAEAVHRAAEATDWADDVLFAAFALLTGVLARAALPRSLQLVAGMAAGLSAVRAVQPWLAVPGLEVAASLLVMAALGAVAVLVLRSSGPVRAAVPTMLA